MFGIRIYAYYLLIHHLEVKVECFLQIEAGWKAFVLLHKVRQGKVPVGSAVSLSERNSELLNFITYALRA